LEKTMGKLTETLESRSGRRRRERGERRKIPT
jgi:hypothetical protein